MTVRRLSSLKGLRYIYIIECQGCYKIGVSIEPGARLPSLQTGNPFTLRLVEVFPCPGRDALKIEQRSHRLLKQYSMNGEWFQADLARVREAVVAAFLWRGVPLMTIETVAHKLAELHMKSIRDRSELHQIIQRHRVGGLLDPALS